MLTQIMVLLGVFFLGAVAVGAGFVIYAAMKRLNDAVAAIRELSKLAGSGGLAEVSKNIAIMAASGPEIILGLKVLNETVNKFIKIAVSNAEELSKLDTNKTATEETSNFFPYNEKVAAALEEQELRRQQGLTTDNSPLPADAVTADV